MTTTTVGMDPRDYKGSNPFLNISKFYDVPYEVIVCYAERWRGDTGAVRMGCWGRWASAMLANPDKRSPSTLTCIKEDVLRALSDAG